MKILYYKQFLKPCVFRNWYNRLLDERKIYVVVEDTNANLPDGDASDNERTRQYSWPHVP